MDGKFSRHKSLMIDRSVGEQRTLYDLVTFNAALLG